MRGLLPRERPDQTFEDCTFDSFYRKDLTMSFGVTEPAISQKLRRLLPHPEQVLDKFSLTQKQKSFVLQKASGASNVNAVLASHDVSTRASAKSLGTELMADEKVTGAIKELVERYIPQRHRLKRLRQHVDNSDPTVSLRGLDLSWKLDGSYAEDRQTVNFPTSITLNVVNVTGREESTPITLSPQDVKSIGGDEGINE